MQSQDLYGTLVAEVVVVAEEVQVVCKELDSEYAGLEYNKGWKKKKPEGSKRFFYSTDY